MSSDGLKFVYSTVQVANLLNIGRSTVNKYARGLEDAGYVFTKDEKERRAFTDHDIVAFRALIDFLDRGVDFGSAVNRIVNQYKISSGSDSVALVATPNSSADVATIHAKVDQLIEVVSQLSDRINAIVDDRVRKEVAAATAGVNEEVSRVLQEMRELQDGTNQKIDELGSRLEAHGKRKKIFGLF